MRTVAAGAPFVSLVRLAWCAGQPVLVVGRHGVGKSQLFHAAATELGIGCTVADLSIIEAPDLVGMPIIENGRTRYALPSMLPIDGAGLLVLEEINRCPRAVLAPALQLLSARRLHEYSLPPRWCPMAAINDGADGYQVEELDEALSSRFLRVRVVPDVGEWTRWARGAGVHSKVIEFVDQSPGVFDEPVSNPRAWTYAARLLTAWEEDAARSPAELATALAGVLDEKWSVAFLRVLFDEGRPLRAEQVLTEYPAHAAAFRQWVSGSKLDLVHASLVAVERHLERQKTFSAVLAEEAMRRNLLSFLRDLPGDLRRQAVAWATERGFGTLVSLIEGNAQVSAAVGP